MLFINFNIRNISFHDDAIFLNDFTKNYNNYGDYLIARYNNWSSRSIIELIMIFFVQHTFLWKIFNSIAMTIIAVLPNYMVNTQPKIIGFMLNSCLFLLIPIEIIKETGWVATTTNYLWVAAASLITLYPVIMYIKKQNVPKFLWFLAIIFSFYANNQEQMTIVLFLIWIVSIFTLLRIKRSIMPVIPFFIITLGSLFYILLCPGNELRNVQEITQRLPEFANYSLFYKIYLGYCSTLIHLFYQYNPLIAMFSLSITTMGLLRSKNIRMVIISLFPMVMYFINQNLQEWIQKSYSLSNQKIYFSLILLLSFTAFIYIFSIFNSCQSLKDFYLVIGTLLLGLIVRMILGFSPTIWASGNRTYFFTYLLLIIGVLINFNEKRTKHTIDLRICYVITLLIVTVLIYHTSLILI